MTNVSVVMAVYNGQRYLREAVESILNQTYTDFEFIVVDDGSKDDTPAILQSFQDGRLRIVTHTINCGQTRSLNHGLELAKGQYIARLDADDLSLPARLARQVTFLDAHSEINLLGTQAIFIDETGREVDHFLAKITNNELQCDLLLDNQFVHGSVMFRRTCLEKAGHYDERYRLAQDYDLWLRLAEWGQVHNLDEPLYLYRLHPDSLTSTKRAAMDSEAQQIVQEAIARRSQGHHRLDALHIQALARYYFQEAIRSYTEGQFDKGQHHMAQALKLDTTMLRDRDFVCIGYQLPQAGQQLDATLPRCQAAVKFISSVMFPDGRSNNRASSIAKKQLLNHFLPGAVFEAYQAGQLKLAHSFAGQTIRNNPIWLRNLGLVSIWLKGMMSG